MQTEKIELETTVVDETKERESYCGQGNRRFSGKYIDLSVIFFALELCLKIGTLDQSNMNVPLGIYL